MSKKLTPWFPASVKPARVGVYNASADNPPDESNLRYWDGGQWLCTESQGASPTHWQDIIQWRGLASDPEAS